MIAFQGKEKNVYVLMLAQALLMSLGSTVVFVGGIIGSDLAPSESLATLPVAALIIGTASFVIPINMLMKKKGRRFVFLLISFASVLLTLFAAHAVVQASFFQLILSVFLLGGVIAGVMQFRFAAIESVDEKDAPVAASTVLLGGIIAAFLGPEVALYGKNFLNTPYAGSFVLLSVVFLLAFLTLTQFRNVTMDLSEEAEGAPRSIKTFFRLKTFWLALGAGAIGYAIMSYVMTATPVSMNKIDHLSLEATKRVIQSHVLAMYVPSFISGWLIKKAGIKKLTALGIFLYLLTMVVTLSGHSLGHYWVGLILLGIGWNFLFLAGTVLLAKLYRPSEKFRIQALNDFVILSSQATASLSAGWVVFQFGWETLIWMVLPFLVMLSVLLIRVRKTVLV